MFSIYSSHHFLHVWTACSPADSADLRRQKTVWVNGSAKADAADSAEKDIRGIRCMLVFIISPFVQCPFTPVPFLLYASFPYYFVVLSLCDSTAILTELAFVSLISFFVLFPYCFLVLSLCNLTAVIVVFYIHRHSFLYVWTACSPADLADYADKRQAGKWNYNYNNDRSRVSRGNKIQKLRKVYHILDLTKLQETHLKMPGKITGNSLE